MSDKGVVGMAVLGGELVDFNLVPSVLTCLLKALVEVINLFIAATAGVDSLLAEGLQGVTRDSGFSSESSLKAAPRNKEYQAVIPLLALSRSKTLRAEA